MYIKGKIIGKGGLIQYVPSKFGIPNNSSCHGIFIIQYVGLQLFQGDHYEIVPIARLKVLWLKCLQIGNWS